MTLENPFQAPEIDQEEPEEAPERPYTPAEGLDPEAPYGWTIDRKTGTRRPKKRAGRVKIHQENEPVEPIEPKPEREPDRVPGRVRPETKRRGRPPRAPKPAPEPLPVFRAGPIAKSVNRLYLRAGKLVRAMDPDIGTAIISMTRKELDEEGKPIEDDITVGEAWEEVARLNPRIRAMLMKLISGGAWSQLVMVHTPLLLALMMKESIARRLPLMNMLTSFLSDDEGEPAAAGSAGGLFTGLTQDDIAQAMAAFNQFMPGAASHMPPEMNGYASVMERNGTQRPATAEDFGLGDATP
jgi:hypothetical protein